MKTKENRKILTAEEVVAEAKAKYKEHTNADIKYQVHYCLGWLKSQYDIVANELRELKNKKT
jgi:AAA+ ATPase superfamily predicted ATPase